MQAGCEIYCRNAAVPSRRFAAAGFLATKEEREIEKEWEALPADHPGRPSVSSHH